MKYISESQHFPSHGKDSLKHLNTLCASSALMLSSSSESASFPQDWMSYTLSWMFLQNYFITDYLTVFSTVKLHKPHTVFTTKCTAWKVLLSVRSLSACLLLPNSNVENPILDIALLFLFILLRWKQEQAAWGEYRGIVWEARDQVLHSCIFILSTLYQSYNFSLSFFDALIFIGATRKDYRIPISLESWIVEESGSDQIPRTKRTNNPLCWCYLEVPQLPKLKQSFASSMLN